jgi:hypothetical protein
MLPLSQRSAHQPTNCTTIDAILAAQLTAVLSSPVYSPFIGPPAIRLGNHGFGRVVSEGHSHLVSPLCSLLFANLRTDWATINLAKQSAKFAAVKSAIYSTQFEAF